MAATVVYDGGCGVCRQFMGLVDALDRNGRLHWVDLHDADYDALPVTEADCVAALQVVDGAGVFSGFGAVRRLCRHVPLLWWLYPVLHVPGVPWVGRRVYRWVAAHRHCRVPGA